MYGNLSQYKTCDNEVIASMLHIPKGLNSECIQKNVKCNIVCTASYDMNDIRVFEILDSICKDTVLHPYVKQYRFGSNGQGAFHAIHAI